MQASRDKSTLIVSAQICHYDLITNNRPLTFETVYQIPILKVHRRPPLLPPEGNFSLGTKHRMVSAGLAPHLETRLLLFLAQVETFQTPPRAVASPLPWSSQDPCLSWIGLGRSKMQSVASPAPKTGRSNNKKRSFLGVFLSNLVILTKLDQSTSGNTCPWGVCSGDLSKSYRCFTTEWTWFSFIPCSPVQPGSHKLLFADKKKAKRKPPQTHQRKLLGTKTRKKKKKRIIGIAFIYFNAFVHPVIEQGSGKMVRKKTSNLGFAWTSASDRWFASIPFLLCINYLTLFYFSSFRRREKLQALYTQQSQQRSFPSCLASQWLAENQSANRSQHCWLTAISSYLDIFTYCLNFTFGLEGLHQTPPSTQMGMSLVSPFQPTIFQDSLTLICGGTQRKGRLWLRKKKKTRGKE